MLHAMPVRTARRGAIVGALVVIVIACVATVFGRFVPVLGGPVCGIVLGLVAGVVVPRLRSSRLSTGYDFCAKQVLQASVVLLGTGLSLRQVAQVGASSLPVMLAAFADQTKGWGLWVNQHLARGDHPLYMAIYTVLILFFTFFYVSITYQPKEVADNLKQSGSFIPGVRAGEATAKYIGYVLNRITVVGAVYLAILALIPLIALALVQANQNFPFGGASILILVGVGLETVKQIDSKVQQHHYEGFLR